VVYVVSWAFNRDSKGVLSELTSASTISETAKPEPIPVNDNITTFLELTPKNQHDNEIKINLSSTYTFYTCSLNKDPVASESFETKSNTSSDGYCLIISPLVLSITLITSRPES